MKQALKTSLFFATIAVLAACNKGGDGGGGGQQVASIPGVPQSVVSTTNPNVSCTFNGGVGICNSVYNGAACSTKSINFTSITDLCTQITQVQSISTTGVYCDVSSVTSQFYTNYCQGSSTVQPGSINTNNPNMKTIACSFEAYRTTERRFFSGGTSGTGLLTGEFQIDGTRPFEFDLQRKFLFDFSKFGTTTMKFTPSTISGTSDTLMLSNRGLNKTMTASQSGFAGQSVNMDITSDDGSMKLSVACSGEKSLFRKNVGSKRFTQYVCRGSSSLYGSRRENIDVSFPYNSSLMDSELNLGEGLTAVVTGDDSGRDNAKITIIARGVGGDNFQNLTSIQTSAYLKTLSVMKASDGYTSVDLKCGPQ